MERIKLSKNEKMLLRNVGADLDYWPDDFSDQAITHALSSLENKKLVHVAWSSGMTPVASELTDFGRVYLDNNPKLLNPVQWRWIIEISIGVSTLIVAIIALCVVCHKM